MTFKNPLNHWRGGELKEPIIKSRALTAKAVRKALLAHPEGLTRTELNALVDDGGDSLRYLLRAGFARMSPSNAKANGNRGELWFAAEPKADEEAAP